MIFRRLSSPLPTRSLSSSRMDASTMVFSVSVEVTMLRRKIRVLLSELAHFVKGDFNLLSVSTPDITQRPGIEHNGLEPLDVALLNCPGHRIGIQNAARHKLAVRSRRGGAEIDDFGLREFCPQSIPACRNVVVTLIELYEIEEIGGPILKHTLSGSRNCCGLV